MPSTKDMWPLLHLYSLNNVRKKKNRIHSRKLLNESRLFLHVLTIILQTPLFTVSIFNIFLIQPNPFKEEKSMTESRQLRNTRHFTFCLQKNQPLWVSSSVFWTQPEQHGINHLNSLRSFHTPGIFCQMVTWRRPHFLFFKPPCKILINAQPYGPTVRDKKKGKSVGHSLLCIQCVYQPLPKQ